MICSQCIESMVCQESFVSQTETPLLILMVAYSIHVQAFFFVKKTGQHRSLSVQGKMEGVKIDVK